MECKIVKILNNVVTDDNIYDPKKDPFDTANDFNDYFTNVGQLYSNKFKKIQKNKITHQVITLSIFNEMFLKKVENSDILNIINKLKDDTATGFDKITGKLLKYISELIVEPLSYIIHLCIKNDNFPDKFKLAIVETLSNYRPISIMLSNFSKMFEKIIKTRLLSYSESKSFLSKNQFGFRPGKNTIGVLYLYQTTEFNYKKIIYNNEKVTAIFLDIAKAFDTVDHNELLKILPSFGIVKESLQWFKSYLANRKQIVTINGIRILSNEKRIYYGVPQGSVLGPILFILYINHIGMKFKY